MSNTMRIRALDATGDWQDGFGLNSYNYALAAIEENIQTSLMSFLNDCFWQLNFGIDWWNLLGAKNPAAQANILLQVRQMIANCFGVTKINSVNATFDSRSRELSIQYNVSTIYSSTVSGSVTPTH